ncbi:glycosyltransferase [Hyunsoonleella flava]|uniref:Glycosyltransferase n=2 Tax=Pseudomonadati TaxID=3379134 RepID=A0A4Q9FHT5_9FLAO|nr:glycosyltransferase [Hyunsoonleella flava]TBN06522.1 glycosyltransferase [Hyunsoonleella flava]
MTKKIDIVFVLPSLVAGGSERITSFVAENIDLNKFNSKLLIAGFEHDAAFDIKNIEVIYLNKKRVLFAVPLFFIFLLKNRPNIVLSSMGHVNASMGLMSYFFRKIKFIGREATILSQDKKVRKRRLNLLHLFNNKFYKKLDIIVCQSEDMAKDMIYNYGISKFKIKIINNPISNIEPLAIEPKDKTQIRFVTVGRLSKEKGHLRIIKLLSKLEFNFTYTIVGDGDQKEAVLNEAKKLGVLEKLVHIPFTKQVNQILSKNDMFLQGSFVEGFPNALLESCVAGIPVIAFDVPGGTKEIVEHGINGFLVKNEKEYIEYLNKKHEWNPELIRKSVYKKFNKEKILQEYEDMFLQILK